MTGQAPVIVITAHIPVKLSLQRKSSDIRVSDHPSAKWALVRQNRRLVVNKVKEPPLLPSALIIEGQHHECPIPVQTQHKWPVQETGDLLQALLDHEGAWFTDGSS